MHAIQTSGNCVRNITADHLSGVAGDEIEDARPWAELLRQFSTFHPEFSYLPRKFKIAITGRRSDGSALLAHDIGFRLVEGEGGEVGFQVWVGGGLGRTPILAELVRPFLAKEDFFTYTEAILRVYNLHGDRQNKHKARIKILLKRLGLEELRRQVEEEWERIKDGPAKLTLGEIERVKAHFPEPRYDLLAAADRSHEEARASDPAFARWLAHNLIEHKAPGYHVVAVSLKPYGVPPGDMTDAQMEGLADLADQHSFGEVRATHEQNLLLTDVKQRDLYAVWQRLDALGLATPNIGTLTDMICCPGLDYCSLANASSISVARQLQERFSDLERLYDLGELKLKMSGCINACGHHHVGHIGILGINKKGEEWYQLMLGGSAGDDASLGRWIGPAVAQAEVAEAVERIVEVYVEQRLQGESFLAAVRRLGIKPFHDKVYGSHGEDHPESDGGGGPVGARRGRRAAADAGADLGAAGEVAA
jgi:sulfite reductase (NADPH) hemoprotein beta-component